MKNVLIAIALAAALASPAPWAAEPPAEKIELTDGSTLYLHPDGTGRMVDAHGKKLEMHDGEVMQTTDGRTLVMKNKKISVRSGPPGMSGTVQKND